MKTKFVVTDPCYIIPDEIWDKIDFEDDNFYDEIIKLLKEMTGCDKVLVEDTGYGDWSNHLYGSNVINRQFCADSGLVCICKLTPEVEKELFKLIPLEGNNFAAVFETDYPDKIRFKVYNSGKYCDWTMIEITDGFANWMTSDVDEED